MPGGTSTLGIDWTINVIILKWEIIWTSGLPHLIGLPHLPGVSHLHVNRPSISGTEIFDCILYGHFLTLDFEVPFNSEAKFYHIKHVIAEVRHPVGRNRLDNEAKLASALTITRLNGTLPMSNKECEACRKWTLQINSSESEKNKLGKSLVFETKLMVWSKNVRTNIVVISRKKMQSEISFSWEKNRNVSTPPLAGVPAKWRLSHVIVVVDKPAQKFHTDDALLPRSG